MRVDCVSCGYEVNLDHRVFDDYSGPVKCYCCGAMMEMRTEQGAICSLIPLERPRMQVAGERLETHTASSSSFPG